MKKQQSGFTLIELIAVIVILGILAATAVPRFINLSTAARQASVDAIAGNLGSASALNYAASVAVDAGITTGTAPIPVANCTDAMSLVPGSSGFEVAAGAVAAGATASCTVHMPSEAESLATATFTIHGI